MATTVASPRRASEHGAGAATVERLLTAAEHLIAEHGVDAVSVRAVNAAAGANVAAVHYHFGSKEALVDAVLTRRMTALTEVRSRRLDAIDASGHPTVREVVEALVLPLADFAADPAGEGRTYVRFLAALDVAGDAWRIRMGEAFAPQYERIGAALARALPDVPEPVREFRLGLAGTTILATLADPERASHPWARGGMAATTNLVVAAIVDHIVGALAAPADPRTTRPTRRGGPT